MKLKILKYMEKSYDSLYELSSKSGYIVQYEDTLKKIEAQAKEYGYIFKINKNDVWKLYKMTSKEWDAYKKEVE